MQEGVGLVVGHRYKVRLKPREELVGVVPEYRFQARWFRDYMDGQVGVLHYEGGRHEGCEYEVFWEDTFWYYKLEHLKILGEVD